MGDAHGDDDDRLIDISVPYGGPIPPWPGDTPFSCGWIARREAGASINLAALAFSAHAGTHADAPLHVESAWPASESLPASAFVGPALVLSLPADHAADTPIGRALLATLVGDAAPERVLIRTGRSVARGVFPDAWPVLDDDAVAWLLTRGTRLVGTDAPSVDERESKTLPVHHALFAGGAFVLENLALDGVPPGRFELLAQPLLVHGADAAPVRAVLRAWESPRAIEG